MKVHERRQEIRRFSDEEITVEVDPLRRKLLDLRTQTVTDKVTDNSQFRKTRRDIARLLSESKRRSQEADAR